MGLVLLILPMFAKAYRFLGSIQLAMPLLSAIALILIGATIYEAQVGSAVVQTLVYKSPWFGALMFMLAVNLGTSAISRYPWRGARKIGFALAHLGLIVLIAGSAAVIHLGAEGMLVLRTDGPARHQLQMDGDLLEVARVGEETRQMPVQIHSDQSVSPKQFNGLSLLGYRDRVTEITQFTEGGTVANPAVRLQLKSDRMGQATAEWLAMFPKSYQQTNLGPAQLELLQAKDQAELEKLLSAPQESNLGRWGQVTLKTGQQQTALDIKQQLGQTQTVGNLQITVKDFWPDFRLTDQSQPTSVSDELRNPVVALEVASDIGKERWYIFAQGEFEPVRSLISGTAIAPEALDISYQVAPPTAERLFRVVVDPQGQLFYGVRSAQGFTSGPLELDQPIQTGWADFQITLTDALAQAQVQRQVVPSEGEGTPGLLVAAAGEKQWLPWGEPTEIRDAAGSIFAAFSPRSLPLPFDIGLEDFIVERNEGEDSVAMWTSKIQIRDPHSGEVILRDVWMNHPTWYQGWKIAQASWNPGDLSQSTLQVKREPLWVTALTWSGALLVVSGISTMFYGKYFGKYWQKMKAAASVPSEEGDAIVEGVASVES